jgi:hypothetical protein
MRTNELIIFFLGQFVTDTSTVTTVQYSIRINPTSVYLPTENTDDVDNTYNDVATLSDAWINSGYLTLQNNLNVYLAAIYDPTATVDTKVVLLCHSYFNYLFCISLYHLILILSSFSLGPKIPPKF